MINNNQDTNQLREDLNERKYKEIFQNSPYSLIITDMKGKIIDCNNATEKIFGYSNSEMINQNYAQFLNIPLNQILLTIEVGKELFKGQSSDIIEIQIKNKSGIVLWIGLQLSLIVISGLKMIQIISQDISERKKAKDRIIKLEKELTIKEKFAVIGEIAASVAHELRNPLAAIKNNIYYLSKVLKERSEDFLETTTNMESDIRRVNKIISDLLNYSRLDQLELNYVNINNIIDNVLRKLKISDNISVDTEFTNNLPNLQIDILRFEQIIVNIVRNAIDAMDKGGTLKISTEKEENQITINIKDTGTGIKPQDLSMIFEPLYSTKVWGFGLGLPIAKKYTELHHGSISVTSELGKYTNFTLKFPISK